MANMNMIIHDMQGQIEIGDSFKNPKFRKGNRLQTFERVIANPMWNQDWWKEADYDNDELDRFPKGAGFPGRKADWGWAQIMLASLNDSGRAAIVLDTGAASRGSGNANTNKEKDVRKWFVEQDLIEGVIYLPENLFYNTTAPGIILFLNEDKPKERKGKLFLLNASRDFAKGIQKTILPMTESSASQTLSNPGAKKTNSAESSRAMKSPKTILMSRQVATFIPVRLTNTGRLSKLWKS